MAQLMNRKKRLRLLLQFAAALGCSSAALSGTLAVSSYAAHRPADVPTARQF
jgi:hypothetical protein